MARPVLVNPAPWHRDHAFGDFCAICHGGDPRAKDEASAHAGMFAPLARTDLACASCHGPDAPSLAKRYRPLETPAPAPAVSRAEPKPRVVWPNVVAAGLVVVLGVGGGSYAYRNERRRRAAKKESAP